MDNKNIHEEEIIKEDVCCEKHHDEHDHHHDEYEHEHDHHHDHDHDHEHSHEHHHHDEDEHCHDEHEHHHDHHDHDEHEHHGHDHDHHHEHDHGHQYKVAGFRIFETHNHEGATICSFEKDVKSDQAVVKKMESCINSLEKWLDETGATIGHVKGYVRESGPVTTFSTVGCGLNIEQHEGGSLLVGFAAIVFGPTEEELKDKVAEIFSAI